MTPQEADIALLKQQVAHLEERLRDRSRGSAAAVALGAILFTYLPHLAWIGPWLQTLDPTQALVFRLLFALFVAGAATSAVIAERAARSRRQLRNERERILFSLSPAKNTHR